MWGAIKWAASVLAGLVAILLVVFAIRSYILSSRLEAKLEEIRSEGDPICIADLAPAPTPADQNAAIPLRRIRDDAKAFYQEVKEYHQSDNYALGRPNESQLEVLEAALDAYPELVPSIEKAVALEGYASDLDYSLPPNDFMAALIEEANPPRSLARVLTCHVTVLRSRDQSDEAIRASIPLFQLAGHLNQDVVLVQYLVAIAIRSIGIDAANQALRSGAVSDETRKLLDKELALADPFPGYVRTLKAERAFGIESFSDLPFRILWHGQAIEYLDALGEEIRLAAKPYSSYSGTSKAATAASKGMLVRLVLPALKSARDATERTRANIRTLRVLNALLGREDPDAPPPDDLTDLGLPKDATLDPFSGKPLLVKRLPEGWKIYSVGPNLADDGGKLDGFADFGVGPIEEIVEIE
jgi:hypothetical protein